MPSCCRNSSTTSPSCWIKKAEDVIELNVCWTRRWRTFGARSVGTRRSLTTSTALSNTSAYGLRGYVDTLSPSLLCISMDISLHVRRLFFSMQRSPTVSSANNKCDIPGALLHILTGVITPLATLLLNNADKPSATNKNKTGYNGSPCRIPRDGANESKRVPLSLTEYHTDVTHAIIQSTHWREKPNFCIICLKKPRSTLSYAFDRSGL